MTGRADRHWVFFLVWPLALPLARDLWGRRSGRTWPDGPRRTATSPAVAADLTQRPRCLSGSITSVNRASQSQTRVIELSSVSVKRLSCATGQSPTPIRICPRLSSARAPGLPRLSRHRTIDPTVSCLTSVPVAGELVGSEMTGHIHLQKSRARFLEEARKELAAFERREREFRKMERKERALYLWRALLTAHLTSDHSLARGRIAQQIGVQNQDRRPHRC